MRRSLVILAAIPLVAGCLNLLSGTRVFQVDLVRDGQPTAPGQPIDLAPGGVVETNLALGDNDTFEKHHDEIKSVDRAGFEGMVENPGGAAGSFSIYFSAEPGLTSPSTEATVLLQDFTIPAEGLELSYAASESAILNMKSFRALVKSGEVNLYLVGGSGSTLQVLDLRLVVTFTVGL